VDTGNTVVNTLDRNFVKFAFELEGSTEKKERTIYGKALRKK
jgi:hypothetical protein